MVRIEFIDVVHASVHGYHAEVTIVSSSGTNRTVYSVPKTAVVSVDHYNSATAQYDTVFRIDLTGVTIPVTATIIDVRLGSTRAGEDLVLNFSSIVPLTLGPLATPTGIKVTE